MGLPTRLLRSDSSASFLDILSRANRVFVTTHVRPDGDAVGTAIAMARGLAAKGIQPHVLLLSKLPSKYAFLFDDKKIPLTVADGSYPPSLDPDSFDALLVFDTGTWSQLPGLKDVFSNWKKPKLVLDHHLTQEDWADDEHRHAQKNRCLRFGHGDRLKARDDDGARHAAPHLDGDGRTARQGKTGCICEHFVSEGALT